MCLWEKEEKNEKCTICKLQMIFNNFEEDLNKNMFDEEFLYDYNTRLKYNLIELFETNKCALCCFLGDKYHYRGRDWTTGYTWNVPFSLNKWNMTELSEKKNGST